MSDTAVARNEASVTLQGRGPAASTECINPDTSAHATSMVVPGLGQAPTSPVIVEAGVCATPGFVRIAKPSAAPSAGSAAPPATRPRVVKLHALSSANALPARSLTPVVTVAI